MAHWLTYLGTGFLSVLTHEAVAVGIGGALGANARYWLGKWISSLHPWAHQFPVGTVIINISGSFLLGLLSVLFGEKLPAPHKFWLLLMGTGFCGGYTTFSTFSYETFQLFEEGKWHYALINVFSSVLAGLAAVVLVFALVRATVPKQAGAEPFQPTPAGKVAAARAHTKTDVDSPPSNREYPPQ